MQIHTKEAGLKKKKKEFELNHETLLQQCFYRKSGIYVTHKKRYLQVSEGFQGRIHSHPGSLSSNESGENGT